MRSAFLLVAALAVAVTGPLRAGTEPDGPNACGQVDSSSRSEQLKRAIDCLSNFSRSRPQADVRERMGLLQLQLGDSYGRASGDTLDKAIAAYRSATEDLPRSTPAWVRAQHRLGNCYRDRARTQSASDLERAIEAYQAALASTDPAISPDRASIQQDLGTAFRERVNGSKAENIEAAIAAFKAALGVTSREINPARWGALQNNLANAYRERVEGERANNLEFAIDALHKAEEIFAAGRSPAHWATVQNNLGLAYQERIRGQAADNLEAAIAAYERALKVFSLELSPAEWAMVQGNLGEAFRMRIVGDRRENLEQAIERTQAALEIYDRSKYPRQWASLHLDLGAACSERIKGSRAENIESALTAYRAALDVYTREEYPRDWARAKVGLGSALRDRIVGSRSDNLEQAIEAYREALQVRTREADPEGWAVTQNNLGNAYRDRIAGNRADNVESAIAAFEASLSIYTEQAFPREWARGRSNLANAYRDRVRGVRATNLEVAIQGYRDALKVYRRDTLPEEWAQTQNSVGTALFDRILGRRPENIEVAIAAFRNALSVYTRDGYPLLWATAETNLATAYANRTLGVRSENLDFAISSYEHALQVFTREAYPIDWATTQANMANAYANRRQGSDNTDLVRAVTGYKVALQVATADALPLDYIRIRRALGDALANLGDWQRAEEAYSGAMGVITGMASDGLNDAEIASLVDEAGPLYRRAAYSAARLGDAWGALSYLDDGRARLLRTALRFGDLRLSDRDRAELLALRSQVRDLEAVLGTAAGQHGPALVGIDRANVLARISQAGSRIQAIIQHGPAATDEPLSRRASVLLRSAAAIVAPVIGEGGSYLVVVTGGQGGAAQASLHPVAGLTEARWNAFLSGGGPERIAGGWVGSYHATFDEGDFNAQKWGAWQATLSQASAELWNMLGHDLAVVLTDFGLSEGSTVLWLPPGSMGSVPMGLAQDPESGRYLLNRYSFAVIPSLRVRPPIAPRILSLGMLIDPTRSLAAADAEAQLVASQFSPSQRSEVGQEATSSNLVLSAVAGRSYWHLLSHGRFDWADPTSSGITLAGGARLSVRDLLAQLGEDSPRLVVLSACESGLSDIGQRSDEFFGLPMALLAGGASAAVATEWPAVDYATTLLVARFYELHLGPQELRPPVALRTAQLWLRDATVETLRTYVTQAFIEKRMSAGNAAWLRDEVLGAYTPDTRPFADPAFWADLTITGL
jgi:CHAT domain-containing protein/tetratricopeptide (TPR) repeat protein